MNSNVNPEILGKILLLQSTLHAMNNDISMGRFLCRGLSPIPGICETCIFIRGQLITEDDQCAFTRKECTRLFDLLSDNNSKKNEAEYHAIITQNENIECLKIETIFNLYGFLIITIHDKETYITYKPYIENTLNLVALVIENNSQKKELEQHKANLEKQVAKRTHELKRALDEKEILLRELYHRTKNNMQVIQSILGLHAAKSNNEDVTNVFIDTSNRIQAMALVHQKLYQSKDLSRIDIEEYLKELIEIIMQSYDIAPNRISFEFDIERLFVLIDTAIPCGLLITELISNALKHAFPNERSGTINIKLFKGEKSDIHLHFSDNGVGVPTSFDFRNQPTLGMQTVFALCEHQLQGEINYITQPGVSFFITFNNSLYEKRV